MSDISWVGQRKRDETDARPSCVLRRHSWIRDGAPKVEGGPFQIFVIYRLENRAYSRFLQALKRGQVREERNLGGEACGLYEKWEDEECGGGAHNLMGPTLASATEKAGITSVDILFFLKETWSTDSRMACITAGRRAK